jgi:hypothetical protein
LDEVYRVMYRTLPDGEWIEWKGYRKNGFYTKSGAKGLITREQNYNTSYGRRESRYEFKLQRAELDWQDVTTEVPATT